MDETYKVCSWDVGIKNLAYCILEKTNNGINIIKWDKINLIDEQNISCDAIIPKKKGSDEHVCGKNAAFTCQNDKNETINLCGSHSNGWGVQTFDLVAKFKDLENTKANTNRCNFLLPKSNKECGTKAHHSCDDTKYYCNKHKTQLIANMTAERTPQQIKRKRCNQFNVEDIAIKINQKLDEIAEIVEVNEIIIENQPSMKNPMMKTVSSILFGYLIKRGKLDGDVEKIRFVSPSNKLKVNENKTLEVLTGSKSDKKYKLTKELAVKYSKILLADDKEHLDFLITHKKKQDDLCDAYLQGYYYMNKR